MRVNVKFKVPMMKNGQLRKVGDIMEIDATQAMLLARKGSVEIPGYSVAQETKQVTVDVLVPEGK